jgi:hypothetical protein
MKLMKGVKRQRSKPLYNPETLLTAPLARITLKQHIAVKKE